MAASPPSSPGLVLLSGGEGSGPRPRSSPAATQGGDPAGMGAPECSICMETGSHGGWACLPSCGHVLHLACLAQWLEHSERCPMCREKHFGGASALRPIFFQCARAGTPARRPRRRAPPGGGGAGDGGEGDGAEGASPRSREEELEDLVRETERGLVRTKGLLQTANNRVRDREEAERRLQGELRTRDGELRARDEAEKRLRKQQRAQEQRLNQEIHRLAREVRDRDQEIGRMKLTKKYIEGDGVDVEDIKRRFGALPEEKQIQSLAELLKTRERAFKKLKDDAERQVEKAGESRDRALKMAADKYDRTRKEVKQLRGTVQDLEARLRDAERRNYNSELDRGAGPGGPAPPGVLGDRSLNLGTKGPVRTKRSAPPSFITGKPRTKVTPSGTFIVEGPDGRGGRTKFFKTGPAAAAAEPAAGPGAGRREEGSTRGRGDERRASSGLEIGHFFSRRSGP